MQVPVLLHPNDAPMFLVLLTYNGPDQPVDSDNHSWAYNSYDKALDAAKALAVGVAEEFRADGYTCEVERVPDRPIFEVADHTESPDAWFRAEVTRCLRPRD